LQSATDRPAVGAGPGWRRAAVTGETTEALLLRIAVALERVAGALAAAGPRPGERAQVGAGTDAAAADAFVWVAEDGRLQPVSRVNRLPLTLLRGIERQAAVLMENTRRFAAGLPANNALLWGARGTGKSSLVKAVHGAVLAETPGAPALVEVHREDIRTLPALLALLRDRPGRFLLFCDDLSFDGGDSAFKSLKTVLEGGIEGRPDTVVFYATSNRRHLMPRDMIENERSTAINPGEAVEEKVSLSDRFGLWLGFHPIDQATYLGIVRGYVDAFRLAEPPDPLEREVVAREALAWAAQRGARSGRVAWQFVQDLAGRRGRRLA
jgi:predicted AAA+ superfamily ATPase